MTPIHADDQAEICALWPEFSINAIAKRFGYCNRRVKAALERRYGRDLNTARVKMAAWPAPSPAATVAGVQARQRGRRAVKAQQLIEDQMLQFQCYSGGPT